MARYPSKKLLDYGAITTKPFVVVLGSGYGKLDVVGFNSLGVAERWANDNRHRFIGAGEFLTIEKRQGRKGNPSMIDSSTKTIKPKLVRQRDGKVHLVVGKQVVDHDVKSVASAKQLLKAMFGSRFVPEDDIPRKRKKAAKKNPRRRRNISQGFVDSTGFHPIRSAADYDPTRTGERLKARKPAKKAKKARKTKKAKKSTAHQHSAVRAARKGSKRSSMTRYRASENPRLSSNKNVDVEIKRVPINSQGYDKGGSYWGVGAPLWSYDLYNSATKESEYGHKRAYAKTDVFEWLKGKYPHFFVKAPKGAKNPKGKPYSQFGSGPYRVIARTTGARHHGTIYRFQSEAEARKFAADTGRIYAGTAKTAKNPQQWVWPKRRGKKNLERIDANWGILHDVGFGGDKTYKAVRIGADNAAVSSTDTGPTVYKRSEALAFIKSKTAKNPQRASSRFSHEHQHMGDLQSAYRAGAQWKQSNEYYSSGSKLFFERWYEGVKPTLRSTKKELFSSWTAGQRNAKRAKNPKGLQADFEFTPPLGRSNASAVRKGGVLIGNVLRNRDNSWTAIKLSGETLGENYLSARSAAKALARMRSNPKAKKAASGRKRPIPAAFKAAAARAKAMTPAQRAAWAAKMQAARKRAAAKRKGR